LFISTVAISQNRDSVQLSEIVLNLEQDENVRFYFGEKVSEKVLEIGDRSITLDSFLEEIVPNNNLSYTRLSPYIIVLYPNRNVDNTNDVTSEIQYNISGRLIDKSGKRVQGLVFLVELQKSTYSSESGYFEISAPAGVYTINAQSENNFTKSFEISVENNLNLNIQFDEKVFQMEDVVVTARREQNMIKNITPSTARFSMEEIERIPSFLGEVDVNQTIKNQAGVTSIGEGSTGFNVRGGQIDQNLILLNDIPIFNSSHLLGFFSIFNPDFVQSFTFNKGNMPASLGGRVSSALVVNQSVSKKQNFGFNGGFGPMNSSMTLDIPIKKLKSGLLLAGRAAYPSWIVRSFPEGKLKESNTYYYDVNLNYDWFIDDKQDLEVVGYLSNDQFQFSADTAFRYQTRAVSLTYQRSFRDDLHLKMVGAFSSYEAFLDTRSLNETNTYSNGINQFLLKSNIEGKWDEHSWNAGVEWNSYTSIAQKNDSGSEITTIVPSRKGADIAIFIEDEFNISQNLSAKVGLRQVNFFNVGEEEFPIFSPFDQRTIESIVDTLSLNKGESKLSYSKLEPRFNLNYVFNKINSLKLGYSRSNQFLTLLSNTNTSLPTDLWYFASENLKPTTSDQFSLGFYRSPTPNFDFSIEGFYKRLQNVSELAPGSSLLGNNDVILDILQGDGRSVGLELSSNLRVKRNDFILNYTLSRTNIRIEGDLPSETINNGRLFPASYDRTHVLNYTSNIFLSRLWSFGAFFTYASGRPYTTPGTFFNFNGYRALGDVEINGSRAPAVHRLDISFTFSGSNRKNPNWETSWTFSIYNVYGHKNPFSVIYKNDGPTPQPFEFAVLGAPFPFITFNIKKL